METFKKMKTAVNAKLSSTMDEFPGLISLMVTLVIVVIVVFS